MAEIYSGAAQTATGSRRRVRLTLNIDCDDCVTIPLRSRRQTLPLGNKIQINSQKLSTPLDSLYAYVTMVEHVSGDFSARNNLLEGPRSSPSNRSQAIIFSTQMALGKGNNSCRRVFGKSESAGGNAAAWYQRCVTDVRMLCIRL